MTRLRYRLWCNGDIIGEWTDPHSAHAETQQYIDAHPEDLSVLKFAAYKRDQRVFIYQGDDLADYLVDIAPADSSYIDEDAEEWL